VGSGCCPLPKNPISALGLRSSVLAHQRKILDTPLAPVRLLYIRLYTSSHKQGACNGWRYCIGIVMPSPLIGGDIKRWCCLTSVCLRTVAYIGPKSRTERPKKTKIGRGSQRHKWLGHHFQGQRVKGQGHRGGAYCGGPRLQLVYVDVKICQFKTRRKGDKSDTENSTDRFCDDTRQNELSALTNLETQRLVAADPGDGSACPPLEVDVPPWGYGREKQHLTITA